MDDRYQHQPWYIKLWRCRYYLPVPYKVLRFKFRRPEEPWGLAWSLAVGTAQIPMKYYYTWEVVEESLRDDDDA